MALRHSLVALIVRVRRIGERIPVRCAEQVETLSNKYKFVSGLAVRRCGLAHHEPQIFGPFLVRRLFLLLG